jgi:hypothetical protein
MLHFLLMWVRREAGAGSERLTERQKRQQKKKKTSRSLWCSLIGQLVPTRTPLEDFKHSWQSVTDFVMLANPEGDSARG